MAGMMLTRIVNRTLLSASGAILIRGTNRCYRTAIRRTATALTVNNDAFYPHLSDVCNVVNLHEPVRIVYFYLVTATQVRKLTLWKSRLWCFMKVKGQEGFSTSESDSAVLQLCVWLDDHLSLLCQSVTGLWRWSGFQLRCSLEYVLCTEWRGCIPPGSPCSLLSGIWSLSQGAEFSCGPRFAKR